jgi:Amt family ammonium transporter
MAMLGCFILLFGWFGFNAASTLAATDVQFAVVAVNTAIAAAFGATSAMFWKMWRTGKADPGMMVNGMLAGLVAITAPCAFVDPYVAAIIGTISGVLVIFAFDFIDGKLKVDDPVGAIAVHGVNGIWGVLCVGLFGNQKYGFGWNFLDPSADIMTKDGDPGVTGIFYDFGVGSKQLAAQVIGALVICLVMFPLAYAFFKIQNALMKGGIRPTAEVELAGVDIPEMGVLAYPEFTLQDSSPSSNGSVESTEEEAAPVST